MTRPTLELRGQPTKTRQLSVFDRTHENHALELATLNSRFLTHLSRQTRDAVLSAAIQRRVPGRTIVTNQEDPADHFFLLLSGRARFFFTNIQGKNTLLMWLAPGDVFGGAALLHSPSQYLVGTEIVKESRLAVWTRQAIGDLTSKYPVLLDNALAIANDYLIWYIATHSALLARSAEQRLAQVLAILSVGIGNKVANGTELRLNNEELASAANLTPFTICRILGHWRRTGAVIKTRGKLIVTDPRRFLPDLR